MGQVLASHQRMPDLRIQPDERMTLNEQTPVLRVLQPLFDHSTKQHSLRCRAEDDSPARLVGLGLERHPHPGHAIHRLGQAIGKPVAHRHEVDSKRVLVSVNPGPDNTEVSFHAAIHLQRTPCDLNSCLA